MGKRASANTDATGPLTIPNLLSVLRLVLTGVFLFVDSALVRGGILVVGGASDWLDGWWSRKYRQRSRFGEVLDPIADKALVAVALVTFHVEGLLELWQLALIVIRDIYTVTASMVAWLLRLDIRFRARPSGKLTTLLQFVTAVAVLIAPAPVGVLVWLTAAAGVWASVDYTVAGVRTLQSGDISDR